MAKSHYQIALWMSTTITSYCILIRIYLTIMEHGQVKWGRPRDDVYGPYNHTIAQAGSHNQHTQQPIVTGSSVLGIKFDKGVIVAADNLAPYGSLARFTDQERLFTVGKQTVVGIGGDISDLQRVGEILDQLEIQENYDSDGHELKAKHVFKYLKNVFYNRRNKMDPLWNATLVGGLTDEGKPFLAYVDLLGVSYTAPCLATGFGAHMALPLMRKVVDRDGDEENLTEERARALLEQCLQVLHYRDGRSSDKYSIATVTQAGIKFDQGLKLPVGNWKFAKDLEIDAL
jgi:20S proteasome subunit beta 7